VTHDTVLLGDSRNGCAEDSLICQLNSAYSQFVYPLRLKGPQRHVDASAAQRAWLISFRGVEISEMCWLVAAFRAAHATEGTCKENNFQE
jgi:uncharacterized protein YecT (DUF1311 family)